MSQKEVIPIGHPQIPKTTRGVDPPVNTNLSCEATTSPVFPWWMRFAVRILTMEIANMLLFDTEYLPGCNR